MSTRSRFVGLGPAQTRDERRLPSQDVFGPYVWSPNGAGCKKIRWPKPVASIGHRQRSQPSHMAQRLRRPKLSWANRLPKGPTLILYGLSLVAAWASCSHTTRRTFPEKLGQLGLERIIKHLSSITSTADGNASVSALSVAGPRRPSASPELTHAARETAPTARAGSHHPHVEFLCPLP